MEDYSVLASQIRSRLTIFQFLDYFKVEYLHTEYPHNIRCPLSAITHSSGQDRHPSCRVFPDTNKLKCFTCGFYGDVIELVKVHQSLDYREAINWILGVFPLGIQDVSELKGKALSAIQSKKKVDLPTVCAIHDLVLKAKKRFQGILVDLLPDREPLAFHLLTKYYLFELEMDSKIELIFNRINPEITPSQCYLEFFDCCVKFIASWLKNFPLPEDSFVQNILISSDFMYLTVATSYPLPLVDSGYSLYDIGE